MKQPLLSIVIPTCNRQPYLISVLQTLLSETSAQLVVSDNSAEPLSTKILDSLKTADRVIYQHHIDKLSVVENFERAMRIASGEYLIFIGDDDCVGPGIEDIARWAKDEQIDAVVSYQNRFIANYFWPGVTSKYFGDGYAGKLFIAKHTGEATPLDSQLAILNTVRQPGQGLGSMARAYHGLVSRALIDRVVGRYGSLFGGVSPDIYSATLLTYEAQNPYVVDYPFVIPGASPKSTAGEGAARADTDKLYGRDHILRFGEGLRWDNRIPAFYSPLTVWAFSQQQALNQLTDSTLSLNFPRLYLRCAAQSPAHRREVIAAIKHWLVTGSAIHLASGVVLAAANEVLGQIRRIYYRFLTPPQPFSELKTVGDAYVVLQRHIGPWFRPKSVKSNQAIR